MSNFSQRLSKLEHGRGHSDYLEEVNLRLMRYAIERRHQVFKDGPPPNPLAGDAGSPEFEATYERIKSHPRFEEMRREVLAGNTEMK